MRKRVAVIGSGVSGLLCARLLAARHDVRLFEAADRLGGHAHTVECRPFGRELAVDVGFMVFNRRTYPNFVRMLELLGIEPQASDMSFSVRADHANLEYQSGCVFAQRSNALRPRFLRMLADILRFNQSARALAGLVSRDAVAERSTFRPRLEASSNRKFAANPGLTVGEFVHRGGYGDEFFQHYLLPMTAAIWSAPPRQVADFPARFLVQFLNNHGLLQLRDRPQWLTIPGGSRRYVAALAAPLGDRIRLNAPVHSVHRDADGVVVTATRRPPERFDAAVLATHAPQTLAMLTNATPAERDVLGAFAYQPNDAALHTDLNFMPRRRRAWASWNCLLAADPASPAAVTYDLTRLQRLEAPAPICATLNPPTPVAANHLLVPLRFEHPLFSTAAIAAQSRRDELHRDGGIFYCGAYWGYGFHEDGVSSALAVGRHFGVSLDDLHEPNPCTVASTPAASPMCVASR